MGVRDECTLIFDGVSSNDIGVTVEGYPGAVLPERDYEIERIPGRNRDIIYDYGTYNNYQQSYTIHWRYVQSDSRISKWLCKDGYKRLEDSFHPEHYRLAHYIGSSDVDNRMQVLKRTDIKFDFGPQWYRKDGDFAISVANGQKIVNTGMDALPLINITGSGAGILAVGDVSISISSIPTSGIVIDCELQDAYSPNKLSNLNGIVRISGYEFPVLKSGTNTVSYSGGIQTVKIIPRWWDLM